MKNYDAIIIGFGKGGKTLAGAGRLLTESGPLQGSGSRERTSDVDASE